jgi:hypothetical protein
MSTTPRNFSITDNADGRKAGRRIAGSYGRPKKGLLARANRGVRRSVKIALRRGVE